MDFPLWRITSSQCCGIESIKRQHSIGIFFHPSSISSFKFLDFFMFNIFSYTSVHNISIGLRSGDWEGHDNVLILRSFKNCFILQAVCLGSLSACKTQFFSISLFANGSRTSFNIFIYTYWSIIPSMDRTNTLSSLPKHL